MRATAHPSRVPRVPASLARPFVLLVPCHSSGSRSCMAHPTFVIGCPAPAYTGRESESQAPSRIKLCCWSALAKCIARLLACIGINVLGLWSNVVWFARLRSTVVNCLPLLCSYFFQSVWCLIRSLLHRNVASSFTNSSSIVHSNNS